ASERAIVPIDDDVRARILERARSAARTSAVRVKGSEVALLVSVSAWLHRHRLVAAAALGLLLFALGAAALYRARRAGSTHPTAQPSSITHSDPNTVAMEPGASVAAAASLPRENIEGAEHGASALDARREPLQTSVDRSVPPQTRDRSRLAATRPPVHDD